MKLNQLLVILATAMLFGCGGGLVKNHNHKHKVQIYPKTYQLHHRMRAHQRERMMNSLFKWSHKAYVEKV
ncbi:hypothetical protein C1E23_03575 [Pseudoalteromonas phenolica]|uniref:Lipoprotein n=1 Tax=Pseudoalteromonas phenolica TaxID=161398 RepID=A0A4Q7IRB3_9GAMM|nr:hypothetical protein C1E23_03575 [Pseudoalteromonas phenolica]